MRDVQASFTDSASSPSVSLATLTAATYLAPNSIDTSPFGAYLSENIAADTQLSANVNTYRELGGGSRMWFVVDVITAVTASGGAATIDFSLITSATSDLGTPTTIYDFGAISKATLVAGYRLIAALPRTTTWLKWLGCQYIVATNTITTGAFVSWIGWDVDAVDLGGASGFSVK
jgi:hypothetical protein